MNPTPYFCTPERVAALRYHAAQLVGTPFVPQSMVPGAGMDCVHVAGWLYLRTGFFATFTPPRYALDSGAHAPESALLAWLDGRPDFARGVAAPAAGDTLCFRLGRSEHHVGVMLDGDSFVHVLPRRRVIISDLQESYYGRRVSAIYRPLNAAISQPRD